MNPNELLQVLWRRKITVVVVMAVVLATAVVALRLVTPLYESTATLGLRPNANNDALVFFTTLDAIVPIYADAATSRTTLAQAQLRAGEPLGDISVRTFEGTPIIKVSARSESPVHARRSVSLVTSTLLERSRGGNFGVPGLSLVQLDRPSLPTDPVFPNIPLSIAVAILLGLVLGMGTAVLRDTLTTKVQTAEALSRLVGAPSYGEVPREPALVRLRDLTRLSSDPRLRVAAEAFRDLRTNLLFTDENPESIVVTSPQGSHGKTTVSVGLSLTLALTGAKTLLIDGDLRKGRVAEMLGLRRVPGLAEALADSSVTDAIRETSVDELHLLTGGGFVGDPVELLLAEFPALLDQMREQYDVIVIDSTPLVPVNDARIMARFVKHTLLVASAESADRRGVRTATERLAVIGVSPTAVVLNYARRPGGKDYYGYLEAEQRAEHLRRVQHGDRTSTRPRWLRRTG